MDITESLRALLQTAPKICCTDARLIQLEMYETAHQIYNHGVPSPDRPLANVAMHYAENCRDGSLMDERLSQFADKQVVKFFGLSLTEFLNLPSDTCLKILEICGKKQNEENVIAGNALNNIDKIAGRK